MNKRTTSRESIDQREDDDQADAATAVRGQRYVDALDETRRAGLQDRIVGGDCGVAGGVDQRSVQQNPAAAGRVDADVGRRIAGEVDLDR